MKEFKEIMSNPRLTLGMKGMDGFKGTISMPTWIGSFICSHGGGWDHVSVAPYKRNIIPTWHDMCMIKDVFWNDNETVIEIHPAKDEYVNNVENCLHLWSCYYKEMVLPPSCFVGIKEGQTRKDFKAEIRAAYELAGEEYQ